MLVILLDACQSKILHKDVASLPLASVRGILVYYKTCQEVFIATLTLTGPAQKLQVGETLVTFQIISSPAVKNPPKGLPLYGKVRYEVQCPLRQWRKARAGDDDVSDLTVEACIKSKVADNGRPFVALVAMSVARQAQRPRQSYTPRLSAWSKPGRVICAL